jgi:hypothetical protein
LAVSGPCGGAWGGVLASEVNAAYDVDCETGGTVTRAGRSSCTSGPGSGLSAGPVASRPASIAARAGADDAAASAAALSSAGWPGWAPLPIAAISLAS